MAELLTGVNTHGRRERTTDIELRRYVNKCIAAQNGQLYFSADEYACSLCNTYLSREIFDSDVSVIHIVAEVFADIGNHRNANILQSLLQRIENNKPLEPIGKRTDRLFDEMKPIITEEIRTRLRLLYTEHDSKYCRDFEQNFIRQISVYKWVSPFDGARILDIGTGFGYFPYVCRHNGHEVDAIDIEGVPEVFNIATQVLNINKLEFLVRKYTPLPDFPYKFDVVTCFQICFNEHSTENVWGVGEWKFFLTNLRDQILTENGVVWLGFNYESDNVDLNLGSKPVEAFFEQYLTDPDDLGWKFAKLSYEDLLYLN